MRAFLLTLKQKRPGGELSALSSLLGYSYDALIWIGGLKAIGWLGIWIIFKTTPVLDSLSALPEVLWARYHGFPRRLAEEL